MTNESACACSKYPKIQEEKKHEGIAILGLVFLRADYSSGCHSRYFVQKNEGREAVIVAQSGIAECVVG